MEEKKYFWHDKQGNIYGPFRRDEEGNPHGGDVVQHYRLLKHISCKTLGLELGKSARWVQLMEKENAVPELISRRQALMRVLGIPPILLFPNLYADDDLVRLETQQKIIPAQEYKGSTSGSVDLRYCAEALQLYWSIYHINGAQNVLDEVAGKMYLLHNYAATKMSGKEHRKALSLLCQYRQLTSLIAGERNDFEAAVFHLQQAIDIAEEIKDPGLQAVSWLRRGLTYSAQGNFDQAATDLRKACSFEAFIPTTLTGRILLSAGKADAHITRTEKEKREILNSLGKAGKIIRDGRTEEDTHFIKLSEGNYHEHMASALMAMGHLTDAFEELQEAHETYPADQIRRHNNIDLLQVRLALQSRQYMIAASTALHTWDIAEQCGMRRNMQMFATIHQKLLNAGYGKSSDVRELGEKLRVWEKKASR